MNKKKTERRPLGSEPDKPPGYWSAYRPEDHEPQYRWQGEGPPPAKWWAADGTLVYRSYADYCDD